MSDPGAWNQWGPPPDPNPGIPVGKLAPAKVTRLIEFGARIVRRHWKQLIVVSAVFGGVGLIVSELLAQQFGVLVQSMVSTDATGQPVFSYTDAQAQDLLGAFLLTIGGSLIAGACLTVTSLAASQYVESDYRGSPITVRAAIGRAVRRAPVAIGAWLIGQLLLVAVIAVTVVLVVAAIRLLPTDAGGSGGLGVLVALIVVVAAVVTALTLSVRFSVNAAVVALETGGPIQALRRSWHLTTDNTWRSFGLQTLVVFVVGLFSSIMTEVVAVVGPAADSAASSAQFATDLVTSVVLGVLTASILPVMLTVLYFDLRVRRDRFELLLPPQP